MKEMRKQKKKKKRRNKNMKKGQGHRFGPATEEAHGPAGDNPETVSPSSLFSLTVGPAGQIPPPPADTPAPQVSIIIFTVSPLPPGNGNCRRNYSPLFISRVKCHQNPTL
jgi:hypothetical protein